MSSWLSFENFLHSRSATWCRYGLVAFGAFGVGSDFYLTHYYEAFDPKTEGHPYVIDWSPIGKPRCQMLLIPHNFYTNYSPWTPKNGDVVIAREVLQEPNYMQLLNGRFVERQTCGIALMRPLEEVQAEKQQAAQQRQAVLEFLKAENSHATKSSTV